ncbi:MAG: hypothetical protein JSU00_03770 [Acidobacteria bacterium]|nr:hypothetical protein [Acidobacteriota bacterium]
MSQAGTYAVLVRHFFGRFFDKESLSPQGEPEANLAQILGLVAVPGAFFVLLFRPFGMTGWDLVMLRYCFVSLSMVVMGLVMVFEWDALLLDRRDYLILTPLPIRLTSLFFAKAQALAMLAGVFLADVNFFGTLFWPGIDGKRDTLAIMGVHALAVCAAGLFTALAIAAIQGVLATLLSGKTYRRVSVTAQTLLMALLVMLLFLTPVLGAGARMVLRSHHWIATVLPTYWFTGFYEQLRPATRNATLAGLGDTAVRGLAAAAALFVLAYLPGYRRHARKILDAPAPSPAGPGPLRAAFERAANRWLLGSNLERAVFHFIGESITRSPQHRLFLATYGGFGAALAVMHMGADPRTGLAPLSLTLSFILVSGLRAAFNFPSEPSGNWIFQISETESAAGYFDATRKWIAVCAIIPLHLALAPAEFQLFTPGKALFHTAYGLTLSMLLVELMFFDFRKAPFTCAYFTGKMNLVGLGALYVLGFTTYSNTMAEVEGWLLGWPAAAVAFFAAAWAAWAALVWWRRRRLGDEATLEYDDGEPMVRTLGLEAH